MFKKRNEACRHRYELFRRHVDVIHLGRIDFEKVATIPHRDFFPGEVPASIHGRVGLRHKEILFAIGGKIIYLIRYTALFHFAIWRLDKPKLINAGKSAHRANQANVWAFRRLDRTNATVMRRMNVAYFESGALPTKTSRTEGG